MRLFFLSLFILLSTVLILAGTCGCGKSDHTNDTTNEKSEKPDTEVIHKQTILYYTCPM
jgi:hypothetical protein